MTVTVLGAPWHGCPIPGCSRKLSATRFPPCHHTCMHVDTLMCAHVHVPTGIHGRAYPYTQAHAWTCMCGHTPLQNG